MDKDKETTGEPVPRPDVLLEDILTPSALAEVYRKFAQAEANAPARMADPLAWENAFTVDELRELAVRVRRGEQVSFKKP